MNNADLQFENLYKRLEAYQDQSDRARRANLIAKAALADADAERLAAMEKRLITDSQVNGAVWNSLVSCDRPE